MTRVKVHIDRLTLTGFAGRDSRAIAAGLEAELARALAQPGYATRPMEHGALDAGRVRIAPGTAPHSIGIQAARAVARKVQT